MTTVVNKSTQASLFATVCQGPVPQTPLPASELKPGAVQSFGGNANGTPAYFYFFRQGAAVPNQKPLWEGYIRTSYEVDVTPETGQVTAITQVLTSEDLANFKALFPDDQQVQGVTLAQLQEHYTKRDFRGSAAEGLPSGPVTRGIVSDCTYARGVVLLDVLFVATGAYGLAAKMNPATIAKVGEIAEPVMTELEEAFHTLADSDATTMSKALAIKDILHVIWSASLIEAIYKAAVKSLSWWDMVLYGTLGMATLAGAFLTDGAALVAMIVAEVATIAFLATDAVHAHEVCSIDPPVQRPTPGAVYIKNNSGRLLVPSSQPNNPSVLLHLDPGTYQPSDSDRWMLEPAPNNGFYIRHVNTNQYITAPSSAATQVILGPKRQDPTCQWIARQVSQSQSPGFPAEFYSWESATGLGAMQRDQWGTSVLLVARTATNSDWLFAWRDEPIQQSTVNSMKIYWKLELDHNNNGWNVWNGDGGNGFPGVVLEGTVNKPDSRDYWCIVSMARSNSTSYGFAMVRSWTDAEGSHIQAWFDAYGSWNQQGTVDAVESIADAWPKGARLTARIVA
jgi:hypothetical protein